MEPRGLLWGPAERLRRAGRRREVRLGRDCAGAERDRLQRQEGEDRHGPAAEEGDFVTLDIDVIDENPYQLHKDTRFHLADEKMPPWAKAAVTGLSIGESKEVLSQAEKGEDISNFEPKTCKITY